MANIPGHKMAGKVGDGHLVLSCECMRWWRAAELSLAGMQDLADAALEHLTDELRRERER